MTALRDRRLLGAIAAGLVALAALALVGRWEGSRNASAQNAHLRAIYRAATGGGPLYNLRLDRYRIDLRFDCFLYNPRGLPKETSAYELCFDEQGRLVQGIDRHTGTPSFASLQEEPALAAIRVPVPTLVSVLVKLGVYRTDPRLAGVVPDPNHLPTSSDIGSLLVPRLNPPPKS